MKRKLSLLQKKLIAATAIGLGFTCWASGGIFFVGSVIIIPALLWCIKQFHLEQNQKAITEALAGVDRICDGKRYLGTDSDVIESKRIDDPRRPSPLVIEQLCRTRSGNWFILKFSTISGTGRPDNLVVAVCDKDEAKRWLGIFPETYCCEFGKPKMA